MHPYRLRTACVPPLTAVEYHLPAAGNRGTGGGGSGGGGGDDVDDGSRFADAPSAPYGFLDSVCGPMPRFFGGGVTDGDDDLTVADDGGRVRRRGGGSLGRSPGGRRPTGSYEDDETYATDAESYDDDDTYDESRKGSAKRRRGRDRKPRSPASTADSPSEMTGGNSEYYDDDTTLATKDDTVMEASTAAYASSRGTGRSSRTAEGEGNSKLITQPLASGFARRSADEEVVESGEDSDE